MNNVSLAIFDTFKTRSTDLTAKAMRQRAIISALTGNVNPAEKTRTAITRRITKSKEWKNKGITRAQRNVRSPNDGTFTSHVIDTVK